MFKKRYRRIEVTALTYNGIRYQLQTSYLGIIWRNKGLSVMSQIGVEEYYSSLFNNSEVKYYD